MKARWSEGRKPGHVISTGHGPGTGQVISIVGQRFDARCDEELPEMADIVLVTNPAVVGSVQGSLDAVQSYPQPCTVPRLDRPSQMLHQGFQLTPVDIAADRLLEYGLQQSLVFLTHGEGLAIGESVAMGAFRPALRDVSKPSGRIGSVRTLSTAPADRSPGGSARQGKSGNKIIR